MKGKMRMKVKHKTIEMLMKMMKDVRELFIPIRDEVGDYVAEEDLDPIPDRDSHPAIIV